MPAPQTVMTIKNIGIASFWASGQEIPTGDTTTYNGVAISGVFADMNFWPAFLSGSAVVTINGTVVPTGVPAVVAFFVACSLGDIAPTA